MNLHLQGKVGIVTGASKGIGAGIAQALAAEGVKVVVNYASSQAGADQVVAAIRAAGGQAVAVQANVTLAADVQRLFEQTQQAFGGVDLVVNNAGIYEFDPIEDVTEEKFQRHFATNVFGPFLTTQQALRYFPATGGTILNISSGASKHPEGVTSLYSATKAALDVLTKAWAKGLAGRHIRVNTIAPGVMETPGHAADDEFDQEIIAMTPLGRLGRPDDVAQVVVFLASDAAGWITGDRVNVSGGLFL